MPIAEQRDEARAILKELEEKYAKHEALGQFLAAVYASLGEKDQAFAWLEKDFQSRSGILLRFSFGCDSCLEFSL